MLFLVFVQGILSFASPEFSTGQFYPIDKLGIIFIGTRRKWKSFGCWRCQCRSQGRLESQEIWHLRIIEKVLITYIYEYNTKVLLCTVIPHLYFAMVVSFSQFWYSPETAETLARLVPTFVFIDIKYWSSFYSVFE